MANAFWPTAVFSTQSNFALFDAFLPSDGRPTCTDRSCCGDVCLFFVLVVGTFVSFSSCWGDVSPGFFITPLGLSGEILPKLEFFP